MDVKQTISNAVDKVEEAVGMKPATPTVEENAAPVIETQQSTSSVVDRSAYNCPDCHGEGLKDENTKCPTCGGTGKV